MRRYEPKVGQWRHWCWVNPGEECGDVEDGWSFKACTAGKGKRKVSVFTYLFPAGCPNSHVVHNHTSETVHAVLTDHCGDEDDDVWLVTEEEVKSASKTKHRDAEIVVNLGCSKKIKGLRMKNIKKEDGGTKDFTVYTSDSPEGPWKLILTDKFPEEETRGCASMKTFDDLE